uniref:Centromere/kinetochore protein zw10 homolog n=1 Tax=Picea sitchensis TaxID=3332 RepID=C0PQW3_PICSI|nr:unknown [Picea sitchensis]
MDIRELLVSSSASELDDSSPVSAPDLHLLKERLHVRSLQIKDRVHKYVKSHYQDFSSIISRASHDASRVEDTSDNLNGILQLLNKPSADDGKGLQLPIDVDVDLCQLTTHARALNKRLNEKKEALALVQTISLFVQRLQNAQQNMIVEQGRLVESAQALNLLRFALRVPENLKDGEIGVSWEPKAFTLLKSQWVSCFSKLQDLLEYMFDTAIQVDNAHSKLYINLHITCEKLPVSLGGVELSSVLTAMDIAGILDAAFARLADSIIKSVIIPVTHTSAIHIVSEELVKNKPVLSWALLSDTQSEGVAPGTLYPKLLQVLKLVYQHICFENRSWMNLFGKLTWPRLSEAVITNCLAKAVPTEASEVVEFQKVLKLTRDFECALTDMMFIFASNSKDDKLSNFASNIEVHFAAKKRNQILARARRLLVRSDFTITLENAVELLFQPATCTVSWAAKQLMEIVHEALQDACSSPTRVAVELYHAARDTLLLYRAIVPVKLTKELNTLCQAAVVVHNDCLYLAQEVLGLAFEYNASFPDGLKEHALFVDLAPPFHQLAAELLNQQVQLLLSGLKEALDQANGFQNTHKKQQSEMASLAVDQVVLLMEKVRMLWQPLLQPPIYKKVQHSILQHLFSRIGSEILMLDDMAVEETLQLRKLIKTAFQNMSSLLKSVVDEDIGVQKTVEGFVKEDEISEITWDQLENLIPSLRKLRRITDLLDMPLKSITLAWESGELIASGFTSLEVKKLIRAVFSDSLLRRECLRRIETTEFL